MKMNWRATAGEIVGGLAGAFFLCTVYQTVEGNLLWTVPAPDESAAAQTDGVTIFTGRGNRIATGVDLGRPVLITGGYEGSTLTQILDAAGRPDAINQCNFITLGAKGAQDTVGNAIETREWVLGREYDSVTLVTERGHMRRAYFELRRVLPDDVTIIPHAVDNNESVHTQTKEMAKLGFRVIAATLEDAIDVIPRININHWGHFSRPDESVFSRADLHCTKTALRTIGPV